jgi:hypothetical protein
MTRVICDRVGVTHTFEAASWHNTRCGQLVYVLVGGIMYLYLGGVEGAGLGEGIVDCMACLAGPSHLTMYDLRDGKEVRAWVRLDGADGPVGSAKPITFTKGYNVGEVTFDDLPIGVPVFGYSYLDEDGRDLRHHIVAFPGGITRMSKDDTVIISIGEARIT